MSANATFSLREPTDKYPKSLTIDGPEDLTLRVDYDDVNTYAVDELVRTLLDVLNRPSIEVWRDAATIGAARAPQEDEDL